MNAMTVMPALGRERSNQDARATGRVPLLELLVVAVLVMLAVPSLILAARSQVNAGESQVRLSVSSDPAGAAVIVDDLWVGTTPVELELVRDQEVALRVVAREPYLEYDLYKPFRTTMALEGDRNLNIWIPRTSAEEQARQRESRN